MAEKDEKETLTTLSKSDLKEMITGAAVAAAQAARQPTAEELAEREAEAKRKDTRRRLMLKLVQTEERAKLKRQQMCRHQKPDGEQTYGGQAFSDGMNRMICLRCQKIMVEEPTPELEIAKTELQRLIDAGKVKVRPDGTIEIYENRMGADRKRNHRSIEEQELEA